VKIVHLEAGTRMYGGAYQVLLLVEGLRERGVENVLVVPRHSSLHDEAARRGMPLRPLPLAGEADLSFVFRFRRLLREEAPDLVHLHSRRGADTLGGVAARAAGLPTVLSRRVDNPEPPWLVGPKYRLFDGVVAISGAIEKVLAAQGVPREKLHCVRSALDPRPFRRPCPEEAFRKETGIPVGVPLVGMAAQFIRRKGHDVLLEAVPRVLAQHPKTHFVLFGEGPLLPSVATRVRDQALGGRVLLPGFRDDLGDILPCLDILVHPARREGLGVILLQAAAAGVPVVASRVGGIPEAVADGETGLLVPPEEPRLLAHALSRLIAEPGKRSELGRAGRRRVREEFSVEGMVEGNLEVYRQVLEEE
jgi:glycosyltransferase involved in cell wall biosynthesis